MKYLVRYFYLQFAVLCPHYIRVLAISNLSPLVLSCALAPTKYLSSLPLNNRDRHGSTPVCTILQKSVTFFMLNIFKKNFQIKSCNLENGLDKCYFSNLLALDMLSCLIRGAWNWPISCLNYSETQERGLWEFKSRRFLAGAYFRKFLEAFAFGAHLGK